MGCHTTANFSQEGGTFYFSYDLKDCQGSVSWSSAATPSDGHFSVNINTESKLITITCREADGQERNLTITPTVNGNNCDAICISQTTNVCDCNDFQHYDKDVLVPNVVINTIPCEGLSIGSEIGEWYCTGGKECPIDDFVVFASESINLKLESNGKVITKNDIPSNESSEAISFLFEFKYNGIKCFEIDVAQEGQEEKCTCEYAENFIKMLKETFDTNGTNGNEMMIASGETKCGVLEPRIDDAGGFLKDGLRLETGDNKFYWYGTVNSTEIPYRTLGINFNFITKEGQVLECNNPVYLTQSDNNYCSCDKQKYTTLESICPNSIYDIYYEGDIGGDFTSYNEGKYGKRCTYYYDDNLRENVILVNLNRIADDGDEDANKITLPSFSLYSNTCSFTATHVILDGNYFCGYKEYETSRDIIYELDYWTDRDGRCAVTKDISKIQDGSEAIIELEYYVDVEYDSHHNIVRGYKCEDSVFLKVIFTKECECKYESYLSACCMYNRVDDSYRDEQSEKITKTFEIYLYNYGFCHTIDIDTSETNKLKLYDENGEESTSAIIKSVERDVDYNLIYVKIEFDDNYEDQRYFTLRYIGNEVCEGGNFDLLCIEQAPSCSCNAYKNGLSIDTSGDTIYNEGEENVVYLNSSHIENCDDYYEYSLSGVVTSADEGLSIRASGHYVYVVYNLSNYGTYNIEFDLYLVNGDGNLVFDNCSEHIKYALTYVQDRCNCDNYYDKLVINESVTADTYHGGENILVCTYEKVSAAERDCIGFICSTESTNLIILSETEIGGNKIEVHAEIKEPTVTGEVFSPTIDMYYYKIEEGETCHKNTIQITIMKQ